MSSPNRSPTLRQFRKRVLQETLFTPTTLPKAMERLGFLQADPIRSPARAQDLILRHRVKNYRAGELEKRYPKLDLEECYLFAYGFASKDIWQAIHPTSDQPLTDPEQKIIDLIREHGPMLPKDLETYIGGESVRNYWGGFSRSCKMTLEDLHDRGALRIARREKGHRVYDVAEPFEQTLTPEERFKKLALAALQSMGATTRKFLSSELSHFRYLAKDAKERNRLIQELINEGRIRIDIVDSIEYLSIEGAPRARLDPDQLRILAPFDPIVRDRNRFEHFFGWTYRFEAYTPAAKRKLGYYAMPILWRENIIGWANASVEGEKLEVEFGWLDGKPREGEFSKATKLEVSHLEGFLGLK